MEKYQQLKNYLNAMEGDFQKFYGKGNKAAGVRIRKSMQELKSMAQAIREDVQSRKVE